MHLIRIDVLQALRGINASLFVAMPAARAAFIDTVVRTLGYIAPADVTILRVLRLEIALEQGQEQVQETQRQVQAQAQAQVQEQEQEQGQGYRRLQQPYVVSSPYPYPPLPRELWDSPPPLHEVVLGSPFQLLGQGDAAQVQVDYSIAFMVEQAGFRNVSQAFALTSHKLRTAVLSGAFEEMLVGIGNNYTLNLLLGVSSTNIESSIESVQVRVAPSSAPSSMPTPAPTAAATTGDKLVVVVSFLLVCAVMLIACLCVFNARHGLIFLRQKRQRQVLDLSALKLHDKRIPGMQGLQKMTERKPGGDELDKLAFPLSSDNGDNCDWEEKTETDADGCDGAFSRMFDGCSTTPGTASLAPPASRPSRPSRSIGSCRDRPPPCARIPPLHWGDALSKQTPPSAPS